MRFRYREDDLARTFGCSVCSVHMGMVYF